MKNGSGYSGGSGGLSYSSFDYSSFVTNGCSGGFHGGYAGDSGGDGGGERCKVCGRGGGDYL